MTDVTKEGEPAVVSPERMVQLPWAALACAVSPAGDLVVVGGRDGAAWAVRTRALAPCERAHARTYEGAEEDVPPRDERLPEVAPGARVALQPGHADDVRDALVFASGVVAATAGADMSVRVWSALSGRCAARLAGHTRAVLAVRALGRGRRVATAAADGTLRVWLLETQAPLGVWRPGGAPEGLAVLGARDTAAADAPRALLCAACWDGRARAYDLRAPESRPVACWEPFFPRPVDECSDAGLTAVCAVNTGGGDDDTVVALGDSQGRVALCDLRQTAAPLHVFASHTKASVNRLAAHGGVVLAAHADGTLWAARGSHEGGVSAGAVLGGFAGAPITGLDVATDGTVVSCTRDGTLLVHHLRPDIVEAL